MREFCIFVRNVHAEYTRIRYNVHKNRQKEGFPHGGKSAGVPAGGLRRWLRHGIRWYERRGGMMMLLILTSVMGYELKTAVGTSVFIMAFTALTGAVSHFTIGGLPDGWTLALCMAFTLLFAQIAAKIANKSKPETLNRVVGVVLVVLGVVILAVQYLK